MCWSPRQLLAFEALLSESESQVSHCESVLSLGNGKPESTTSFVPNKYQIYTCDTIVYIVLWYYIYHDIGIYIIYMLKYYIYIHNILWYILILHIYIYIYIYEKNSFPSCRKSPRPDQATWEGHWTHVTQSWCPVSTNLDCLVLSAPRSKGRSRGWTSDVHSWHSIEVVVHAQWLALLQGLSGSLVPAQSKSWYPFCVGGQWGFPHSMA